MSQPPDHTFRPYTPADLAACMLIFDGNTPQYFDPSERADFQRFLEQEQQRWPEALPFFLLEVNGQVIGCGGLSLGVSGAEAIAGLTWGMVVASQHKRGWGQHNLEHRLNWLRVHHPEVRAVILDTSPRTQGFFERLGFRVTQITTDGYGPGLDRVDMRLNLG